MSFAIFRVQKLRRGVGKGTLSCAYRHLQRHAKSAEISNPELSNLNMFQTFKGGYDTVKSKLNAYIKQHNEHAKANDKRSLRNDASVAIEMIFSYSKTEDNQTLQFAKEYEQKLIAFVKETMPHLEVVAFARHTDEESFHWHVIGIPFNKSKKKLSSKDILGGKKDMSELQTKFAKCVECLGLKRGIPKAITKKNHTTKEEYNRLMILAAEEHRQKLLAESRQAVQEVFGLDR